MTSDAMGLEPSSADAPAGQITADLGVAAVLGSGMAHRARSQSVLGQHWSATGLIGAVGRASVGFGLAVGRSASIRPTVRFDDLNSAALRPSFDVWRRHRDLAGDDMDGVGDVPPSTSHDSAPGQRRSPVADAATRGSGERLRRHQPRPIRPVRPTWTDQIIERSSVGYAPATSTGAASAGAAPAPVIPADFVSSGDPKLDQLRLLVSGRDGGTSSSGTVGDARSVERSMADVTASASDRTALRRTTAGDPTVAVVTDGPGRLARAMRPESALAPAVPQARLGGPSAPGSPTPTDRQAGDRADAATVRRSPMPGRPAARSSRSSAPTRVDQLRAALIEQGILESDADEVGAQPPSGDDRPPRADGGSPSGGARTADRADRPRSTTTAADLQRAASGDGRRSGATTPRTAPPSSPTTAGPPTARTIADIPGSEFPAIDRESGSADAPARVAHGDRPSASQPASSSAPVTSRSAHQLRSQRLMRSGLAPAPAHADASDVDDDVAVRRTGVDVVAGALATTATIETIAAQEIPEGASRLRPAFVGPSPVLTGVDSSPTTVVRRVTLPRALSKSHRPAPQLVGAGVRDVPGTTRTSARVSAVSLVEAKAAPLSASGTTSEADATPLPPDESIGPVSEGGLLGVVRRLATSVPGSSLSTPRAVDVAAASTPSTALLERGPVSTPDLQRSVAPPAARGASGAADTASTSGLARTSPLVSSPAAPAPTSDPARAAEGTPASEAAPAPGTAATVRPAERVAEQFMTALSETIRRSPAPLPTTYRPLADAIAGPRPVMLSTDTASRKALRSVGKVAATTGDTIHLDPQAVSSARLDEVMAHELTHIAHPSPAPRFFDDIDDSPEERRAEQVAKVMARSPLAPSATTSAPPARRRRDEGAIRRSPASGSGTVSAATLAASLTRTGGEQVQRWESATPSGRRPQIGSRGSARTSSTGSGSTSSSSSSSSSNAQPDPVLHEAPSAAAEPSAEWFRTQLDANIERIIRLVEDRMIIELERRGGRTWRST